MKTYLVTLGITVEVLADSKQVAIEIAYDNATNGQYDEIFRFDSQEIQTEVLEDEESET